MKPYRIASHRIASYILVPNHIVLYRGKPEKHRTYFNLVTIPQRVTFCDRMIPWNIDEQAKRYWVVIIGG